MNTATGSPRSGSNLQPLISGTVMSDALFSQFSKIVFEESGINLALHKKAMLVSRLNQRLRSLGIGSFSEYYDYLCGMNMPHNELLHFIDSVSTNKTEFFRESFHFDFLGSVALPELVKSPAFRAGGNHYRLERRMLVRRRGLYRRNGGRRFFQESAG